jgi:hypothetical protein
MLIVLCICVLFDALRDAGRLKELLMLRRRNNFVCNCMEEKEINRKSG